MGITSQSHLGLGITTISSIKHESYTIQTSHQTSSTSLPGLLLCWSKNYIAAFFLSLACTKSCSNACFSSRSVVHQIVFYFVVPGLVCLFGNCCWWFLCNVCNLQSFMKVLTIGSGTDWYWQNLRIATCILNWFLRAPNGAKKACFS